MKVIKNRVYKHFKGNYYLIIDIGIDATTDREVVIYRALYGDGILYVRDKEEFESLVDTLKYPNVKQKYRFELQEKED